MRIIAAAATSALFAVATANAQPAPPPAPANAGPVCLSMRNIDHTHTVDPTTILFTMRDGKVWKNTLKGPCPGLMFHGFAELLHVDEICSNAQSIEVLVTHEVCALGAFTPYVPPPRPATP